MTPPPPWPGMPPKPKKTNWEAIGAVAGIIGVLIALVTLAATVPGGSTPNPYPAPANSWASTYAPPQEHPSMPTAVPPQAAPPTVAPPNGGPPAGCQQGGAAIARYNNTVGSTPYSEQQAASRAEQDTYEAAMGSTSSTIREDLQTLSRDFAQLAGDAGGLMYGAPEGSSRYNIMRAQTQKDSQVFNTDCNAAG